MSAMPRLPDPLTPNGLRELMRERPYWDPSHPRSKIYHRLVQRGFEILYPGPVRYGPGGRTDTPPLKPQYVAHLVEQTNREMETSEREFDGNPSARAGGAVHVQSHTRDSGKVEVSDYWRARPGEGGGSESSSESPQARNFLDEAENAGDETDDKPRRREDGTADDPLPAPDTREPVDPETFYRKLEFDPNGEGEWEAFRQRPWDAARARMERSRTDNITREEYPGENHHNNEADAFRHAHWSFEVARKIGPDAAKEFGDAHERSEANPTPERLMDLYNNKVGRDLAMDPENAGRDARDVIREAIREGKLKTSPFETNEPRSPLPDRAPRLLYRPPGGQRR